MNLRDFDYIATVAETGHFGQAARLCNVSQPTLSGQILKLEKELGVTIFERAGRRAQLTQVGEQIVAEAIKARASARAIHDIARAFADPLTGAFSLGMIPTIAPYLAPRLLPAAERALPAAPLAIIEDFTEILIANLIDGKLDAAILGAKLHNERLQAIKLYDEPLHLAASANHRLMHTQRLRAADIAPDELLLLKDGNCLSDQTIELCGNPIGSARKDSRGSSLETLMHLAAAGYGVLVAPESAAKAWGALNAPIATRPIEGATRPVQLVFRASTTRRAAIEKLYALLREAMKDHRLPQRRTSRRTK